MKPSGNQVPSKQSFAYTKTSFENQLFSLKPIRIENARQASFIEWKTFTLEMFLCFFSLLSIITIVAFDQQESQIQSIFLLLTFLSILNIVFLILYKCSVMKLMNLRRDNSSHKKRFIVETIVQLILYLPHPTAWTQEITIQPFDQNSKYTLNDLLSICVLVRSFTLSRFFFKCLMFYGTRAHRLSKLSGFEIQSDMGLIYSIKCFYKSYKISSTFLSLVFLTIISGYLVTFGEENKHIIMDFDMIYYTIMSFTTVGYGDIVPRTAIGRFFIAVSLTLAQIPIALCALHLLQLLNFSQSEQSAFSLSKRLKNRKQFEQLQYQKIGYFLKQLKPQNNLQLKVKKLKRIQRQQQGRLVVDGQHLVDLLRVFSQKSMLLDRLISMIINALNQDKEKRSLKQMIKSELVCKAKNRVLDNREVKQIMDLIFNKKT